MKDYVAGCQPHLLFALEILFSKVDTIQILSRLAQNIEMQLAQNIVRRVAEAFQMNLQLYQKQCMIR